MKRENRYLVIKRTSLACLNVDDQAMLAFVCYKIDNDRYSKGKAPLECVVVESDWPEYEPTWKAIEARVDGQPTPTAQSEQIEELQREVLAYSVTVENLQAAVKYLADNLLEITNLASKIIPTVQELEVDAEALTAEIKLKKAQPDMKDTQALVEIDRVMLQVSANWPDVETDAMVVRHVKQLTRMLNAALEEKKTDDTLWHAVANLRRDVRVAWMTGVEDYRCHYDSALFALLGIKSLQDLYVEYVKNSPKPRFMSNPPVEQPIDAEGQAK